MLLKIYCLWKGLWFSTLSYFLGSNIFYHINIAGDHDTYESSVLNKDETTNNWLKMQICHSANFANSNTLWTHMFGGINYQIEHHIFPNICHIHYPKIKKIVKDYCIEKGYPYVSHETVWSSYKSFLKNMKYLN